MGPALAARSPDLYLDALFGESPRASYVELRSRAARGMRQTFHHTATRPAISESIGRLTAHTDVYIGVLPRRRRGGTRDDVVESGQVVWVDCDSPSSISALLQFGAKPSMTVATGTGDNVHAYWLLHDTVPIADIEQANRALARLLGGDIHCTDAARILRPPSLNHKHSPPVPVRLVDCDASRRWYLDDFVELPPACAASSQRSGERSAAGDELLHIETAFYIARLAGLDVGHSRKVRCPFHDDRTPSLHVYRAPARGWYCYGCGRGGTIYDFAAHLWGCGTQGRDFVALRSRLADAFLDQPVGGAR